MKKRNKNNYSFYLILLLITIVLFLTKIDFSFLKSISANIFIINTKNKSSKEVVNSEIKELRKEIKDLKDISKIESVLSDKKTINASIIKRSIPYWYSNITINKGSKDGIEKGYAVMDSNGLIGEVSIVNKNTSEVRLITNLKNNNISAKFSINDTNYYGLITRYNFLNKELYLENVIGDLNKEMVIDKEVITSGLSSNMPSGLLIGKIIDIKKDKYNLSNTLIIKTSSNIDDTNIISVVGKND